jgi:guanyl-specific ribonuclease Sa
MRKDSFGLAEEPEESEEQEIDEAIEAFLNAEALSLMNEIRDLDPNYGEAFPPGYQRTPADVARLQQYLRQLREQNQCRVVRVPSYVKDTLDRIKAGVKAPYRNDGTKFQNREGILPSEPPGYYTDYVVPTPGVDGPGPQRVVVGAGGETYYTPDHYNTFTRIN